MATSGDGEDHILRGGMYLGTSAYNQQRPVKPNTHRRRRRDETVESRRVGVDGVYMNSQLAHDDCRRIRSTIWKLAKQTVSVSVSLS